MVRVDNKSKLPCLEWAAGDVWPPGVGDLGADPKVCYRTMDWLLEIEESLAEAVYDHCPISPAANPVNPHLGE